MVDGEEPVEGVAEVGPRRLGPTGGREDNPVKLRGVRLGHVVAAAKGGRLTRFHRGQRGGGALAGELPEAR